MRRPIVDQYDRRALVLFPDSHHGAKVRLRIEVLKARREFARALEDLLERLKLV